MKTNNKTVGAGLLAAVAASLCCITPVLALIAGTSSFAATFSWLEPFRPYLIGLTVLILALAWHQKLKPEKEIDCDCETDEKIPFTQSKKFLGIVTIVAAIALVFPYYSNVFYPETAQQFLEVDEYDIQTVEFTISGMTCNSCTEHVKHEVNKLDGIVSLSASYEEGNAIIDFDTSKTDITAIEKSINSTGYIVVDILPVQIDIDPMMPGKFQK